MKTKVTEILGIQYPIIQGGMQWLACADFASHVSNNGGLGIINSSCFKDPESFRNELKRMKELTKKPFGVNISLLPGVDYEWLNEMLHVIADENVTILETAGRKPIEILEYFNDKEITLIHKVTSLRHALKAESFGADIVSVVGYESAGHPGMDCVTSNILAQKCSKKLKVPLVVGGGVIDERGLISALALGAEGIVMGTRFVMTRECKAHIKYKEMLKNTSELDTVMIQNSIKNPLRAVNNRYAKKVLELERNGTCFEELLTYISGECSRSGYMNGETDKAIYTIGQSIGLIDEVVTIRELFNSIITGTDDVLRRINQMIAGDEI